MNESSKEILTGRWTNEEHEKFLEALSLYGKDWKRIQKVVGSRSSIQVKSHAQKYFDKISKETHCEPKKKFQKFLDKSLKLQMLQEEYCTALNNLNKAYNEFLKVNMKLIRSKHSDLPEPEPFTELQVPESNQDSP
mmetsp:Transcript_10530/g.15770  ORF Transcript_10530/g.15770 Transcript_10530/m.15770 type:complete len:136 (+) Transcript_10530:412-819(+)